MKLFCFKNIRWQNKCICYQTNYKVCKMGSFNKVLYFHLYCLLYAKFHKEDRRTWDKKNNAVVQIGLTLDGANAHWKRSYSAVFLWGQQAIWFFKSMSILLPDSVVYLENIFSKLLIFTITLSLMIMSPFMQPSQMKEIA